jgi:hypothetical protein
MTAGLGGASNDELDDEEGLFERLSAAIPSKEI